ncbi:MAG: SUMF1/EgtB/PvdO family nonheme iron enzyme [Spirochaetales bacterium]|jgi:gamma-glutamyl hercynylcysteine S-oxide synthase|nr:SUMF1/EgtB/PvdO family nonheme iron enzyme [Spirochaetales bacterium]
MAKSTEETEDISEVEVKLRPILGLKPGLYLTILYGLAAVVVLFLLLFLPGIRRNGTLYNFESTPSSAAVYIDNQYAGSTPSKIFVEKGTHVVTVSRPFFQDIEEEIETPGRLIGSLFAKRKAGYSGILSLTDPEGFLTARRREIAEWSLVNQFGPSYQPPRLISSTISDALAADLGQDELWRFLESVLSSINGEIFLADFVRAFNLLESGNQVPNQNSIVHVLRKMALLKQKYQSLPLLVSAVFNPETISQIRSSSWFSKTIDSYRNAVSTESLASETLIPGNEVVIAGLPFVRLPKGDFTMGMPVGQANDGELLHPEYTSELFMLKGEVTREWYESFISQTPQWRSDNKSQLIEDGLVNEGYLQSLIEPGNDNSPISYVSFYAASAFANWFKTTLPDKYGDYIVRLPTETEWEWASRLFDGSEEIDWSANQSTAPPLSGKAGVENLLGGLWEWCATWFHPAGYFVKSWDNDRVTASTAYDTGAEAVVRGGSWASNEDDRIDSATRGSQPPEWCTPFTGFRIVLVRD